MKIVFVLGARSEWGYIRPVYLEAERRGHDAVIWACNTAALHLYGDIAKNASANGFKVANVISTSFEGSTHYTMAKSIAAVASSFADFLANQTPSWVVLAGDRAEQLGAAIASTFQYIPTAHIQAGERSGNIDGMTRHAIGRLVHLHFAANEDAAVRLERSGEELWRIVKSGAPQLDDLSEETKLPYSDQLKDVPLSDGYVLGVFHPVTSSPSGEIEGLQMMSKALNEFDVPVIWIAPNNDAGALNIRKLMLGSLRPKDKFFENVSRPDFAKLLEGAQAIVGNSSAGILEAPFFETPAVNIGTRQSDRLRGKNVIDVEINLQEIRAAITKALSKEFKGSLLGMESPYGDGFSAARIIDSLEINHAHENLTQKRMEY